MESVVQRRTLGNLRYRPERGAVEVRYRESSGGVRRSFYVKGPDNDATRKAAETELARRVAGVESHTPANLTVGRWLDEWLELQDGAPQKTRDAYRSRVDLYLKPVLGRAKLRDLEPLDITRAMRRLETMNRAERERLTGVRSRVDRLGTGTVEAAFKVLTAALADAAESGKTKGGKNPCRLVRIARATTQVEPPSQADLDRLFEAIGDHPWRAVFSVMRYTGARVGEVLGMEWRRQDLDSGVLRFVKQDTGTLKTRKSVRQVVAPRVLVDELRAVPRRVGTDLVFSTSSGGRVDERNLLRVFDRALDATGLAPDPDADLDKYRPHDLRHAFATWFLESGVGHAIVASILGHASIRMLDRYSHVQAIPGGDSYRRLVDTFGPEGVAAFGLWQPWSADRGVARA